MIAVTTNADKIQKKTKIMGDKLKKLEIAHKKISIMLDAWVQRNFKSSGKNTGGWKSFGHYCVGGARSPYGLKKTCGKGRVTGKASTRKLDKSAKLLMDTGALRISFRPFSDRKNAGIGSKTPYSKPHEKGQGHLPKRKMLPKDSDVNKEVMRIYEGHIKDSVK